ncbi:MAG: SulP family inorganic anion transporter [Catalinimonas sp.]
MFRNFFSYARYDLPAGLVVFLVALPLCLGIALASGAPLFSGIITGIVGGIVVGLLTGSQLSVSGPAAGLTVIVLDAIGDLGGFDVFLLAVVIAGVMQLLLGVLKAGIIGAYFPSSVIRGMLAAIGLTLILKQIPHFLGVDSDAFGEMKYDQPDGRNTFTELIFAVQNPTRGPLVVGIVSLVILLIWETRAVRKRMFSTYVPGALVAVVVSVLLNELFKEALPALAIEPSHLVPLPVLFDPNETQVAFQFPDFGQWLNGGVYVTAATIAVVATLETLLSLEAVDKLDPMRRRSDQNKELRAQGIGNIFSGLIGGLPMTSVIVRSSTNVNSGGRTRLSAIFHGVLLAGTVFLIPRLLNMIPLSALAAILLVIGYKLTKVEMIVRQFRIGWEQFIPFAVTIVAILFTDLLVGILIGMAVGVFFILRSNYRTTYFYDADYLANGTPERPTIYVRLSEHISFLNKASLRMMLDRLPENSRVVIDGTQTRKIDHDALEILEEYQRSAPEHGIHVELINVKQNPEEDYKHA